ncbi:MAG: hypothetical protein IT379_28715 [Deltaproteobacteria bacterium]|nr:hypothetical protein [Deltaproteobacteria bacterium]
MANALLMIGWKRPVPGREEETYAWLMREAMPTFERWRTEGRFERHEIVTLTPYAGTLNSFVLLFGQREALDALRRTDEFEAFSIALASRVLDLAVVPGLNLEGIQALSARRSSVART